MEREKKKMEGVQMGRKGGSRGFKEKKKKLNF